MRNAPRDSGPTCGQKAIARCALGGTSDKGETPTEDLFDVGDWGCTCRNLIVHEQIHMGVSVTAWPDAIRQVPLNTVKEVRMTKPRCTGD